MFLPLHLLVVLLLSRLGFHLLHLDGVGFTAAHVQLMVAHAQSQDPLVDAQSWSVEHEILRENTQITHISLPSLREKQSHVK